jgi:hypothetical protein
VAIAGWNAHADRYTLLYRRDPPDSGSAGGTAKGAPASLLLKALAVGDQLLVTLASPGAEPSVLEVSPARYYDADAAAPAASPAARYQQLDELVTRVTGAVASLGGGRAAASASPAAAAGASAGGNPGSGGAPKAQLAPRQGQQEGHEAPRAARPAPRGVPDDDSDPLRSGPPRRGAPRPLRPGARRAPPARAGGCVRAGLCC